MLELAQDMLVHSDDADFGALEVKIRVQESRLVLRSGMAVMSALAQT